MSPALGMIPGWQFSQDPSVNPKISTSPGMVYPDGYAQSSAQPIGPYYDPASNTQACSNCMAPTALAGWGLRGDDDNSMNVLLIGLGALAAVAGLLYVAFGSK